jgi:hypothetical protein
MLRKIIIQKRIEVQKVKHTIKLQHILIGQLSLLIEWKKLERNNQESIEKLTKKLLALSTIVPLTHGLKVIKNQWTMSIFVIILIVMTRTLRRCNGIALEDHYLNAPKLRERK